MTHTKSHVIYMHFQVHDRFRCISSKMIAVLMTEQIPEWRIEPSSRLLFLIQVPFHPVAAYHARHTYMLSTLKVLSVFAVSDLSSKCYCTSPPFHHHRGRVSIFCHTLRGPLVHQKFYFPSPPTKTTKCWTKWVPTKRKIMYYHSKAD